MTQMEWVAECQYISDRTDDVKRRKLGSEFNHDPMCFIRYCQMQRRTALAEGFYDAAEYIEHCIDDAEAFA